MSHPASAHDDNELPHHVAPVGMYVAIFAVLVGFTALTVGVSFIHLGSLNLAIAVVIATIKAGLVVTYFMHLKDDSRLNALIFLGALLFAGVFLAYTLNDTEYRAQIDSEQGAYIDQKTGERAPGGPPEQPHAPAEHAPAGHGH